MWLRTRKLGQTQHKFFTGFKSLILKNLNRSLGSKTMVKRPKIVYWVQKLRYEKLKLLTGIKNLVV